MIGHPSPTAPDNKEVCSAPFTKVVTTQLTCVRDCTSDRATWRRSRPGACPSARGARGIGPEGRKSYETR